MSLLAYNLTQTGKPVVLLCHGFLGSAAQWDSLRHNFADFDLLLIELPGHGNSESCEDYTLQELAHEINDYLENHNIDTIHFVGHSMGGYLGSVFAINYPKKTQSLSLINSIASADTTARKQLRNRAIHLIDRFQDTYVSMAISNLFTEREQKLFNEEIHKMKLQAQGLSLPSVLAALRVMRDRDNCLIQLQKQKTPVFYMYAVTDTVIPKEIIENEVSLLNCPFRKVDGGHMLILTHPEKIKAIAHFIEKNTVLND